MTLHHVLDDRQAETGSAGLARAAAVDAIEALGEAREMGPGDAAPAVDDRDLAAAVVGQLPGDVDPAAVGRVADRVADQVADRAQQLAVAAGDLRRAGTAERDRVPAGRQRARLGLDVARTACRREPICPPSDAGCPRAVPASAGRRPGSTIRSACCVISVTTRFCSTSVSGRLRIVSRKPASTVSGVLISCETLATKSRRIASVRSRSVWSCESTSFDSPP